MNTVLQLLTASAVIALVFLLALLCFCLRDSSRDRLRSICEARHQPDRFGRILRSREQLLLVFEIALLLLIVSGSWIASRLPSAAAVHWPGSANVAEYGIQIARTFGIALLIGLVGVALPWSVAHARGEAILCRCWPLLNLIGRLTRPVWRAALRLDRLVHRFLGVDEPVRDDDSRLHAELLTIVDESRRRGIILSEASQMIHRLVDLHDEDVDSIKTPRTDMVTISAATSLRDAMLQINESGYSRIPVTRNGIDDVIGVIYARDLLNCIAGGADLEQQTVESVCRTALYVPETQGIDRLMDEMRQKKLHLAIVVDEYSGVSGLVTMEDILEEIVGHIADEFDADQPPLIQEQHDGITEVDGRASIDELNEKFGYGLPDDSDFETISGFLMAEFGRIPRHGESCQWNNLRLTIQQASERSIDRVRVERLELPEDAVQM